MKSCLPLLGVCCVVACSVATVHTSLPAAETSEEVRDMSVSPLEVTAQYAPHWEKWEEQRFLNVKFKNTGKKTIRLMDKFTSELMRILFFSFNIKDEQGNTVVRSPAMANVSFRALVPYKAIEPGKSCSVTVPLDERIRDSNSPRGETGDYKLPPGKYTVELTYRSWYGLDNVKGDFKAPPVSFTVE